MKENQQIAEAHKQVNTISKQFRRGLITDDERYERVIGVWNDAKDQIQQKLIESFNADNPIFMMSDSGARGNISNFTQLAGMRGLMAAPNGKIMELPILSNFREGLSVLEMFISTHGVVKDDRYGAKTANSGYWLGVWLMWLKMLSFVKRIVGLTVGCGFTQSWKVTKSSNRCMTGS